MESKEVVKYGYDYGQIGNSGNLDTSKNNGQLGRIESYISANKQWAQKFNYDPIGRISQAAEYSGDTSALSYKQVFDYDRFGNLYRKNASNPTAGKATPLPYTTIEDSDISKSTNRFTTNTQYDDAGNVIQDTKYRNANFSYDANGRMFKTTSTASSNQSNAVYDASGQRVAQQIDGVWQFYIYDVGGKKIAEYGGAQAQDEGGIRYIFTDWQGSTRAITGEAGQVQTRMDYTAFGEEINANVGMRTTVQGFNAPNKLDEKYAQTERDKATGLDHTWFRKLENQGGRWTSPDPYNGSMSLGNPQSFNRYSYVLNNPIGFIDPSGLNEVAPIQACSYSGKKDADGNPVYDGHIGSDGRCQSDYGSAGVSAGGWGGIFGGGYVNPVTNPRDPFDFGGGGGSALPPKSNCSSKKSTSNLACIAKCMNDSRVDKIAKAVGDSTGIPYAGEFLEGLTWTGTAAAIGNQGLNLLFGAKPGSFGSFAGARSATSWQHKAFGEMGVGGVVRRSGFNRAGILIGRAGKVIGRAANVASLGILVFEGAYTTGTFLSCSAICQQKLYR